MTIVIWLVVIIILFVIIPGLRIIKQYEKGVIFRFGKIIALREPGLNLIIPYIDQLRKVDMRTITLPVPAQQIITKDNVSLDISAVAYFKVVDAIKSIVSIENAPAAINQIAQTSVRNIVGKFQLDEILSEREVINSAITKVIDGYTEEWGMVVPVVEIKDIVLPDTMQRAMAKQAEAEREKRAKIIAAEGEFLSAQKLADTADIMMAHPIALQLRNLQTMAEISTEKNSTIIFPAQFFSTIQDIQKFIGQEK
jgi:regulator of protease activity HflC (stomatin/prohibitin superfamily)